MISAARLRLRVIHEQTQTQRLAWSEVNAVLAIADLAGSAPWLDVEPARRPRGVADDPARPTYSYDALSNLTVQSQGTETTTYSHDASSRLTSSSGPAGDATYTYDAAGYMTAIAAPDDQDSRFAYDAAGRLTELASPEADQSYTYGPSGRRVAAETSTEETGGKLNYLWDPSFSLGQIAEISGSQERSFAYGRGRIAQTGPGGSSYLHTDNLGSVVATSDERGQRSSRTTYNPYGGPAEAKGGSESSSFAYTGQLRDEETGRYHLRARDYDPEVAAFQTPDPISPGLGEPAVSPYSYVGGRPTTMVDPSGMIGIGDVTPDFIEEGAKAVDDNVIDPVGSGISAAPGVVDDGWDATAGVRHAVGGALEDGYNFVAPAADELAFAAAITGIAACTIGTGGVGAAVCTGAGVTAFGAGGVDAAYKSGVVGPGEADFGEFGVRGGLLALGGGVGKGYSALRNFHRSTPLPGGAKLPALANTKLGSGIASQIPRAGQAGFNPYALGISGGEFLYLSGEYLFGDRVAEAQGSTLGQHSK